MIYCVCNLSGKPVYNLFSSLTTVSRKDMRMTTKLKEKVIAASRQKCLKRIFVIYVIYSIIAIIILFTVNNPFISLLMAILGIIGTIILMTLDGLSEFSCAVLCNNRLVYCIFSVPRVTQWYLIWFFLVPLFYYIQPYFQLNFGGILFISALIIMIFILSYDISKYCKKRLSKIVR